MRGVRTVSSTTGYRSFMAAEVAELVRFGYEQLWGDGDVEYRGRDGMRRYWETIRGAFASLHMDVAHVVERGERS